MVNAADDPRVGSAAARTARWPTGAKLLVILSVALLPLAIIAVVATIRTIQIADTQTRAGLRVAASESSRALSIELLGDLTALRATVDALDRDPSDAASCARARGVFAQQEALGLSFAVFGADGRLLCGRGFAAASAIARATPDGAVAAQLVEGEGLRLGVDGKSGGARGAVFFPTRFLSLLSRPSGFTPAYGATLTDGERRLELHDLPREATLERRETNRNELGLAGLALEMQIRTAPISSPLVIALLLPLLMWAAAAGIAWFVVDRLLIRPLRELRARVAAFTPGDEPDSTSLRALPAQEIRELGDTFRALTRTVAIHEAGLAEGLVRQTRLTREVHHRVKNNLQVIASLINFHARSAATPEAARAYASIQRRVDALAVVHRNHYAEMEENRGLNLRSVIGELASNIRATAPDDVRLGITLDVDPFLVTQDVAVAASFIVTELIELALTTGSDIQVRISLKPSDDAARATLRLSSRALVDGDALQAGLARGYGRVIEGLSRQLRAPLHHEPLTGTYEIALAVSGRD